MYFLFDMTPLHWVVRIIKWTDFVSQKKEILNNTAVQISKLPNFLDGIPSDYKRFLNLLKTNSVSEKGLIWLVSDAHPEFFIRGADYDIIYNFCLNLKIMLYKSCRK
jgi:hypothetical protein